MRLILRQASTPQAQGADCAGYRYCAQLVLEGVPYRKPKHQVGATSVGLDLGPSSIAIVPQEGEARLLSFCSELKADQQKKRRLQRKLDRERLDLRTLVPSIAQADWESAGDVRGDALAGSDRGRR